MDLNVAGSSPVDRPLHMKYKHTVLGGTFDRIHSGHILYLKTAFECSDHITIGLTTQKLHSKKDHRQIIQDYSLREKELIKVIRARWPKGKVQIVPIDNIYGPSIEDPSIDSIVLTDETLQNGKKINTKRKIRGLRELEIILYPTIAAQDDLRLSSSRIRGGEIDRKGSVYKEVFSKNRVLPENLRSDLRKALGHTIKGTENEKDNVAVEAVNFLKTKKYGLVIAVGDIVSSTLKNAGFSPDINIIDFKTQRKLLSSFKTNKKFDTQNKSGTISSEFAELLKKEIDKNAKSKSKKTITIDGEEDLLVIPAVLLAPLESVVMYGQRNVGVVIVRVTEEIKKQVSDLVSHFS